MSDFYICRAAEADLPSLTEIYNDAVVSTVATLDLEPWTTEGRRDWFRAHNIGNHPLIVAKTGAQEAGEGFAGPEKPAVVAGYASLSPLFAMRAYEASVELSIYVARPFRGRGIGSRLMEEILRLAAADAHTHMVVSKITAGNAASVRLHQKYGFEKTGVLREAAWKFGRRLDVEIYQLRAEG